MPQAPSAARGGLADEIRGTSGQDVALCFQCKVCTSGCPLAGEMDLVPHALMRALQVGRDARVLGANTFWLCASCLACTARCPQGIDVARVMDGLRIIATRRRVPPRVPEALIFSQAAVRSIRMFGRLFEAGVGAEINLRTWQPLRAGAHALRLWRAGRLRLLPDLPGRPSRAPAAAGEIAYYPGCALHASAREYDTSARGVAEALGLALHELEGWRCCGATAAHQTSAELATDLPMANLTMAAQRGFTTITAPCVACFSRLRYAQAASPERAPAGLRVQHLLHTLLDAGLEEIRRRVRRPLGGLRVACYYGCLLTRPPAITGAPSVENPREMDRIIEALGGEPVEWSFKTECCGAGHAIVKPEIVVGLVRRILRNAQAASAEAVAVACPLCHHNLDALQDDAARAGDLHPTPVFFFTQLLALAFGLDERTVGLDRLLVDPRPLLQMRGLLPVGPQELGARDAARAAG
ncbi:MAG: heterodisulfide reductase-related iron-sulfur binding cluster [Armatimonadota bacterium]|nr:heterodisulfide reductase-related iron-sulfur binding cluster [Armatimonadota bacterium]